MESCRNECKEASKAEALRIKANANNALRAIAGFYNSRREKELVEFGAVIKRRIEVRSSWARWIKYVERMRRAELARNVVMSFEGAKTELTSKLEERRVSTGTTPAKKKEEEKGQEERRIPPMNPFKALAEQED